jgi:hypothetical protein
MAVVLSTAGVCAAVHLAQNYGANFCIGENHMNVFGNNAAHPFNWYNYDITNF